MSLTIRFLVLTICVAAVLTGCAPKTSGSSQEWRLQNLEEKSLHFQDKQLSQEERLAVLEQKLMQMEQETMAEPARDVSAPAAPKPLMSSPEMPEPTPPMAMVDPNMPYKAPMAVAPVPPEKAKPVVETEVDSEWNQYPATKPEAKTATMMKAKAPAATAGMASNTAYKRALKLVRAGKTGDGRKAFEAFLLDYPSSTLIPNAKYWIGECYYHDKKYAEAIVSFRKVHQAHPAHDKAAAALLKIGYAYDALGDKDNARFYLNILVQDYPKSDPAPLARKRMQSL